MLNTAFDLKILSDFVGCRRDEFKTCCILSYQQMAHLVEKRIDTSSFVIARIYSNERSEVIPDVETTNFFFA